MKIRYLYLTILIFAVLALGTVLIAVLYISGTNKETDDRIEISFDLQKDIVSEIYNKLLTDDSGFMPYSLEDPEISLIMENLAQLQESLHEFQQQELSSYEYYSDIDLYYEQQGTSTAVAMPESYLTFQDIHIEQPVITTLQSHDTDEADENDFNYVRRSRDQFAREIFFRYAPTLNANPKAVYLEVYKALLKNFNKTKIIEIEQTLALRRAQIHSDEPSLSTEYLDNMQDFSLYLRMHINQSQTVMNTVLSLFNTVRYCGDFPFSVMSETIGNRERFIFNDILSPYIGVISGEVASLENWDFESIVEQYDIDTDATLDEDAQILEKIYYHFKKGDYETAGEATCNKYLVFYEYYEDFIFSKNMIDIIYQLNPNNTRALKELAKDGFDDGFTSSERYSRFYIEGQLNKIQPFIEEGDFEKCAHLVGKNAGFMARHYIWEYLYQFKISKIDTSDFNQAQKRIFDKFISGFKNRIVEKLRWWITDNQKYIG